jgi:hypothetical protein
LTKHSDFLPFYAVDPIVATNVQYANYSYLITFNFYRMSASICDCSSKLIYSVSKDHQSNFFTIRNAAQATKILIASC